MKLVNFFIFESSIDGTSAVKALQLAAEQEQRIYQIGSSDMNTAMADLRLDISVEDEIRQAVGQGRIAVAHTNNISVPGWSGAGYLILDPEVLDGSYKISGGGNGGYVGLTYGVMLGTALFAGYSTKSPISVAAIVYSAYKLLYGDDVAACLLPV